jgi:hypothetical protein
MNNKITVTEDFISYSLELANDILGYNECFDGDKEVKKKLKLHIKKCNQYLNKTKISTCKENKDELDDICKKALNEAWGYYGQE